jgi:hypothetical protein
MTKKGLSQAAAQMGREGGSKRVPKGLARMSAAEKKRIQSMGGKARWKGKKTKRAKTG